jgi:hypothetical protein
MRELSAAGAVFAFNGDDTNGCVRHSSFLRRVEDSRFETTGYRDSSPGFEGPGLKDQA